MSLSIKDFEVTTLLYGKRLTTDLSALKIQELILIDAKLRVCSEH